MPRTRKISSLPSAMSGTLTRSRSEIFLHRTRSGRARPDSKRRRVDPPPPPTNRRSNSVKDLRSKRVFSDHKVKIETDDDKIDEQSSGSDDLEISNGSSGDSGEDSMQATPPLDLGLANEFDGGNDARVSPEANLGDSTKQNLGLSPCSRSKLIGNPNSISYRRLLPYLQEVANDGLNGIEILKPHNLSPKVENTMPTDLDTGSKFVEGKGVGVLEETNFGNSSKDKLRLSPSRSKLVRNPNSISYKRLLSYLKGLDKDESSGIEILQSHNPSLQVDKTIKETPLSLNPTTEILHSHNPLPQAEKIIKEMPLLLNPTSEQKHHAAPLGNFPMVDSGGNNDFVDHQILENPILSSHVEIVQKFITEESCRERELPPDVSSKVMFNNHHVDELNKQEQKVSDIERCKSNAENLKVPAQNSEDMIQSTPPDADLASKFDGTEVGSVGTILKTGLSSASKGSLGLVSYPRSKLYRNPSSFSYRRLLPYLMGIAKNDSGSLETSNCQDSTTKSENSIEEMPSVLNGRPLPIHRQHTKPLLYSSPAYLRDHNLEVNHVSKNLGLDPEGDIQMSATTKSPNSCNKNNLQVLGSPSKLPQLEVNHVSKNLGLDPEGDIQISVTTKSPNSCNKNNLQVLSSPSEIPQERLSFEPEMLHKSSFCTPATHDDLSFEELSSSAVETDWKDNKKVSQNRVLAPKKTILKRHSRGCKGICMCLDCASFRVHAERAFEFSRRQITDADEVVERLVKELQHLRNLMERSLVPMVNGTGNYNVLQVNQEQVKGVCQRAFRVEEQAKSYMRQMFCDLNTHCKTPGPRVTFSNKVDERSNP